MTTHASFNVPQDQPVTAVNPKVFFAFVALLAIVGILAGALLHDNGTSSTSTATAPVQTKDQLYIQQLASIGVVPLHSEQGLIFLGHQICAEQQLGGSPQMSAVEYVSKNDVDYSQAQGAVAIAIRVYCPQYNTSDY